MSAATQKGVRSTHNIASELHRALSAANMSIADLAKETVQSEAFIRSILVGENGISRLLNMALFQSFADATGRTLTIKISPTTARRRRKTVESDGE